MIPNKLVSKMRGLSMWLLDKSRQGRLMYQDNERLTEDELAEYLHAKVDEWLQAEVKA